MAAGGDSGLFGWLWAANMFETYKFRMLGANIGRRIIQLSKPPFRTYSFPAVEVLAVRHASAEVALSERFARTPEAAVTSLLEYVVSEGAKSLAPDDTEHLRIALVDRSLTYDERDQRRNLLLCLTERLVAYSVEVYQYRTLDHMGERLTHAVANGAILSKDMDTVAIQCSLFLFYSTLGSGKNPAAIYNKADIFDATDVILSLKTSLNSILSGG